MGCMNQGVSAPLQAAIGSLRRLARGAAVSALAFGALSALGAAGALAQQTSAMVVKGRDGWLFPGWGSLTQVDERGIDDTTRLVAKAHELLAARGVKLEVLLLPDKTLFYEDKLPEGRALSPAVRQRYRLIVSKLERAGIPTFDDAAIMQQLKTSGQEVFYRTDQHWTQAAADAAAQATAQMIARDVPKLGGQVGSGMKLGAVFNERRYGDLAQLFLTPDEQRQVGREVYTVRRQADDAGLLDDAPAPVHVTGHSMVQPYFGFPQKLSNLIDRPVSVNWKPGNVGPWIVLLEYVESSAFKQQPPQVLVWQMFEPTYEQGPDASGLWDNASIMSADAWLARLQTALGHRP
ncbi:twin-arginine translocation pathway signal [Trinickia caryophylli]|nr:twin-arginine translocation pathway signal [Trinickia caryophylli]TRX19499.1 twin-arginine translocation pathway signal [Trinickia caryophylli]